MKKTGLLLIVFLTLAAAAQQPDAAPAASAADQTTPAGTQPNNATFPMERLVTPTFADLACAGFISKHLLPNANFVAGGLQTPNTTKFAENDIIYLSGQGYQLGQKYTIVRELRDPNRFEMFPGQFALLHATGQPYSELATVRVVDTRSKMAIAHIDYSCEPVVPGDIAIPYAEKPAISFHPPLRFDRFMPPNGKASGRIVMAKDFDTELGNGMKVYINVGSNQGVKVGDYFRAFRSYEEDRQNPVDSISFKASTDEDTQAKTLSLDPSMLTKGNGPVVHVRDLPRRAVGEVVILATSPTSSTGMIVFSMEDVHVGDGVELDAE
jgi:hypothetical protein